MSIFTIDIDAMATTMQDAAHAITEAFQEAQGQSTSMVSPELLSQALQQYFMIMKQIEHQDNPSPGETSPAASHEKSIDNFEMKNLGDYGLNLLQDMEYWAELLEQHQAKQEIENMTIPVALWAARHLETLSILEPVVNTLSTLANSTTDTQFLSHLVSIIGEIIEAVAPDIKQDLDNLDPNRPWRLLNLNYGIVATRTHDPEIMETVFSQLLSRLPNDAPEFFKEGMQQMDIVGYPDHVRSVMEKFYLQSNKRTLH